jgi:hypothetical protein
MNNKTNETVSIVGLWITLIVSIVVFVHLLASVRVIG